MKRKRGIPHEISQIFIEFGIESRQQHKIQFGVKITEKMALILTKKHMTKASMYCIV